MIEPQDMTRRELEAECDRLANLCRAYKTRAEAERALIRADVEALSAAWVRGDSVEVSRLLVKLRGDQ